MKQILKVTPEKGDDSVVLFGHNDLLCFSPAVFS